MLAFVFDTETTDLIANSAKALDKQPHIIEFYGCLVDTTSSKVKGEVEFFCDPGIKLSETTIKITGITDETLKGAKPWKEHQAKVQALLKKSEAVVAHNLSYDYAMVNFEAQRTGKEILWPGKKVCTVEGTEHLKGFRLSLTALHELLFEKPFDGAHRARVDVEALTRCYLELLKRGEL